MVKVSSKFILVAKDSTVDANDNMLSISKVIDNFNFELDIKEFQRTISSSENGTVGIQVTPFVLITSWHFDKKLDEEYPVVLKINIIAPGNKIHTGEKLRFTIPRGLDNINLNVNFSDLPVSSSGNHEFQATLYDVSDKKLASATYPFTINITEVNQK